MKNILFGFICLDFDQHVLTALHDNTNLIISVGSLYKTQPHIYCLPHPIQKQFLLKHSDSW